MVSFPFSLHSISVSMLSCKDNHWTQVVQFFWTFSVENGSFHILTNFTIWTIHVWFTQNTCVSLNRTWRGNKLLLKRLFLWAGLARLAGLIRLTKFFLRWKPTIQKVLVSGRTPAASTAPKLRIYLAIPLVHIIHSTLLSVNGNKNSVLKMY